MSNDDDYEYDDELDENESLLNDLKKRQKLMKNIDDDDDYALPDGVEPIDVNKEIEEFQKLTANDNLDFDDSEENEDDYDLEDTPSETSEEVQNVIESLDDIHLGKSTSKTEKTVKLNASKNVPNDEKTQIIKDIDELDKTKIIKDIKKDDKKPDEPKKEDEVQYIDPDSIQKPDETFSVVDSEKMFAKRIKLRVSGRTMWYYFIRPVEDIDVSGKDRSLSIARFVLVTRRPFEEEFYFSQSILYVKGFEMAVKTGECDLVLCDWMTDDTPLLFCDYSKADAFKTVNALGDIQFIKSNKEKIKDRLIYYLRKFIMQEEQELKEAYYKIEEYEEQLTRMRKKEVTEILKRTPIKNPLLKEQEDDDIVKVQKAQYYALVMSAFGFIMLILILIILGGIGVLIFDSPAMENTTTTTTTRTSTKMLMTLLQMRW